VEGLAQGGFAVITKTHHCMVDGVGLRELGIDQLCAITAHRRLVDDAPRAPVRAPG
jgi:hypothetical protein